jgi:phenylacetate-coenzyme A ligase PaaK-like adenylate-forming protein
MRSAHERRQDRSKAGGEEGELVFTSLTKDAMPVIRYRMRDLTRLLPGSATAMRHMAKISGRSDDSAEIQVVHAGSLKRSADKAARH